MQKKIMRMIDELSSEYRFLLFFYGMMTSERGMMLMCCDPRKAGVKEKNFSV